MDVSDVQLKVLTLSRQFIATIGTFEATRFFFVAVFFLFSPALLYLLYVCDTLHTITLSSRLSVTHTICLHFHFSVKKTDIGEIQIPSISFGL